ncbi:alpha/beta hydrolase [Rhodococcus sp. ARC_M5]|uniref:alpha/beta fold hydrolase n=1 Tax=Rhodococcus sp. ARC_M5 TaxID=2928851 RepID=UPI0027DF229E|nr:alpha/beta hydrolase [Rhodococcus sp. ARC_M5]
MTTKTYVLVHGGFHGGWCWNDVAARLRSEGHAVTTPTLTGLGERSHLLSYDITLETFVQDVVQHIEYADLNDVVLVGHSFGGAVVTAVADRIAERIDHLVYIDAMILFDGETPLSQLDNASAAAREALAVDNGRAVVLPNFDTTSFGIPLDHPQAEWIRNRLSPHPFATFTTSVRLHHPVGNGIPATYVAATAPSYAPLADVRAWIQANRDWNWIDIDCGHDVMILEPERTAYILSNIR